MKQGMNATGMLSRRTAEQESGAMGRAARFFFALRVFFFGYWSWRGGVPVCEDC